MNLKELWDSLTPNEYILKK